MSSVKMEEDRGWFDRGVGKLKEEVAALETQLAGLEQKSSRSPALLQMLGQHLGFGAAGKLEWARFKLKLKRKELDHFETQYRVLAIPAKQSSAVPEPQRAPLAAPEKPRSRRWSA
jgi:hypothetical protein